MDCIVLKNKKSIITQDYSTNHQAIDIVAQGYKLDYIIAHSDGKIVFYQDGFGNMKGSIGNNAYGNCIKIDHQNGYCTLYAHMKNDLPVKNNQFIKKGEIIGYMSDSGNAYGAHLHFEVWYKNKRINPKEFLNKEFPLSTTSVDLKYKIGDIVKINGVYTSSTSKAKLRPLIKEGKITKIIKDAPNPYLIENGKVGWVNDNVIMSIIKDKYLSNKNYKGSSIVDALKQIGIDSSYKNRSKIALANDIKDYKGTTSQNTHMLNLLKQGKLKY